MSYVPYVDDDPDLADNGNMKESPEILKTNPSSGGSGSKPPGGSGDKSSEVRIFTKQLP
jgi:hypothetical protein